MSTAPPVATSRGLRVWRHAVMEASIVIRNGEQLLLTLVVPLGLLLGHAGFGDRLGIPQDAFVASVLALGMWSTGFTSLAIVTGFERRYGVLERLVCTPLTRFDLVVGKAVAMAMIALGQAAVVGALGIAIGWRPAPTPLQSLLLALTVPLALVAFSSLALILAGSTSAELTLGLSNLIYLVGAALGVMVPPETFPAWAAPLLSWLPATALADAWRSWSAGTTTALPTLVCLLWAGLGLALARKVFRWTS